MTDPLPILKIVPRPNAHYASLKHSQVLSSKEESRDTTEVLHPPAVRQRMRHLKLRTAVNPEPPRPVTEAIRVEQKEIALGRSDDIDRRICPSPHWRGGHSTGFRRPGRFTGSISATSLPDQASGVPVGLFGRRKLLRRYALATTFPNVLRDSSARCASGIWSNS
jgi:hypothetical protein